MTAAEVSRKLRAMAGPSSKPTANANLPVVRLAELPRLADDLAGRMRERGFVPDAIVYVETGARLFAHELARTLALPVFPIWVHRGGRGAKRALAPLIARLPVAWRDQLRRIEERSGIHQHTRRVMRWPDGVELRGQRVLVVDDAADTGRTIALAREAVSAHGVARDHVQTAVLAATTTAAQHAVDFFLLDRNCRMPWSSDSDERVEAAARAAALAPSYAPRDL